MLGKDVINQMNIDELRNYAFKCGEEAEVLCDLVNEQHNMIRALRTLLFVTVEDVTAVRERHMALAADLRDIESHIVTKYSSKTIA